MISEIRNKPVASKDGSRRIRALVTAPFVFGLVGAGFGLILALFGSRSDEPVALTLRDGIWQYALIGAVASIPFAGFAAIRPRRDALGARNVAIAVPVLCLGQILAGEYLAFGVFYQRVLIQKFPLWMALYAAGCGVAVLVVSRLLCWLLVKTRAGGLCQPVCGAGVAVVLAGFQGLGLWLAPGDPEWMASVPPVDPKRAPNVLMIVADTLRADRLNCYGYTKNRTSPFLDELAERGALFENAVANGNWTFPSHSSMFTGRHLIEHGRGMGPNLGTSDLALPTLAQVLSASGYQTAAISNNEVLLRRDLLRGFKTRRYPPAFLSPRKSQKRHPLKIPTALAHFYQNLFWNSIVVGESNPGDDGAHQTFAHVSRWFDGRDPNKPFFLFLNYMEPHSPYRVPAPHRNRFTHVEPPARLAGDPLAQFLLGPLDKTNPFSSPLIKWRMLAHGLDQDAYSRQEIDYMSNRYDESIAYLDMQLRRLFEFLQTGGHLENTLVIFTSDHGEAIGDHGNFMHARNLHEELVHVPLIVLDPTGKHQGKRYTHRVQLVDLLPTLVGTRYPEKAFDPLPGANLFDAGSRDHVITEWCFWSHRHKPWAHLVEFRAQARVTNTPISLQGLHKIAKKIKDPTIRRGAQRWADFLSDNVRFFNRVYTVNEHNLQRREIPEPEGVANRQYRDFMASAQKALYDGNWKYLVDSHGVEQLYHLGRDPEERINLVATESERVKQMRKRLEDWQAAHQPATEPTGEVHALPYTH